MPSEQKDIASTLREWSVQAQLQETRESTVRMRAVNGLAIAADEIERLRADREKCHDIMESQSHQLARMARENERQRAELVSKADELAATVRELRKVQAERDEARRENCRMAVDVHVDEMLEDAAIMLAERKGWDCFQEDTR